KRCVRISAFLLRRHFFFHLPDAFPVALAIFPRIGAFGFGAIEWTSVAVGRFDLVRFEQQTAVSLVKQINVPERNRADGVAVICAFERKEFWSWLSAARATSEFVGELERYFERGRTIVTE